ncbi:MAG: hypothetical protein IIV09_10815, partial [Selenomonadaceae bacterium]|nr:hypothetical protein [Selenomonadaceae bacterium]
MRYAVFASTEKGLVLAGRIAVACEDVQVTVYLQEKLWAKQGAAPGQKEAVQGDAAREGGAVRCDRALADASEVRYYKRLSEEMADAFVRYDALIFIMAAGI